jgi:hypothetical protein
MEIDVTQRRGPLTDEEKQCRRANQLCLYCGGFLLCHNVVKLCEDTFG